MDGDLLRGCGWCPEALRDKGRNGWGEVTTGAVDGLVLDKESAAISWLIGPLGADTAEALLSYDNSHNINFENGA